MSNFILNSTVNREEAAALKEMIFKRARERAEAMTQEAQNNYTETIKNDIMDIARKSLVSEKNPFAPKEEVHQEEEIGFKQRHVESIKAQINYRNRETADKITTGTVDETMAEARMNFSNKKTFMGALDFLNTQATISLVNKKGKKFEALA